MGTLTREDIDTIDALARHYRCPLSEVAEMKQLAAQDSEVMEGYRRQAAKDLAPKPRLTPAYQVAMAELERLGVKRRKSA